jgi:ectoine hydroxylase-related dioxygenase (phytanoyl-CoA dioxygenase family)
VLGTTAILHLQNGIVLEPHQSGNSSSFQETLHRDFPRYLDGYVASLNSFICLSNFSIQNGATKFVVGSHQKPQDFAPNNDLLCQVEATRGDVIFFDSTIWHAGGINETFSNRNALNMQWTKSFIKQQIDHVRLVGQKKMTHLPARLQQVLGQYTRIPASMSEYYVPPEERLYRSGQG